MGKHLQAESTAQDTFVTSVPMASVELSAKSVQDPTATIDLGTLANPSGDKITWQTTPQSGEVPDALLWNTLRLKYRQTTAANQVLTTYDYADVVEQLPSSPWLVTIAQCQKRLRLTGHGEELADLITKAQALVERECTTAIFARREKELFTAGPRSRSIRLRNRPILGGSATCTGNAGSTALQLSGVEGMLPVGTPLQIAGDSTTYTLAEDSGGGEAVLTQALVTSPQNAVVNFAGVFSITDPYGAAYSPAAFIVNYGAGSLDRFFISPGQNLAASMFGAQNVEMQAGLTPADIPPLLKGTWAVDYIGGLSLRSDWETTVQSDLALAVLLTLEDAYEVHTSRATSEHEGDRAHSLEISDACPPRVKDICRKYRMEL